jgi:hypothetical protein
MIGGLQSDERSFIQAHLICRWDTYGRSGRDPKLALIQAAIEHGSKRALASVCGDEVVKGRVMHRGRDVKGCELIEYEVKG